MKIGYTLDEKIFDILTPAKLLNKTSEMGVSSIEMSPDKKILSIKSYFQIARLCRELNIDINYHVPYFADNFLYEIMNFNGYKKEIKTKYEALVSIISDIQDTTCKPAILTVHGANYEDNGIKETALYNTLNFFDWFLNFLAKKNITLRLALETLNKNEPVIGNCREEVQYIINEFKSYKLGICWDISHDASNYYPGKPPLDDSFYDSVIYCHIHGINSEKNKFHIPMKNSDMKFDSQINFLLAKEYSGILNLELLVDSCSNSYSNDLFNDIALIKSLKTC